MRRNYGLNEHEEDINSQWEQVKKALGQTEEKSLCLFNNSHLIMMIIEPESELSLMPTPACNFAILKD